MRDDRERIQDILDAISHIEKYASKAVKLLIVMSWCRFG